MVERILLPEARGSCETAVDAGRGKTFPRFALPEHRLFIREGHEDMHVIRHHHEIGQLMAIAVEMAQAVRHDLCRLRPAQDAVSVALVEMMVPALRKDVLQLMNEPGAEPA